MRLYKFRNINASSIRTVMIAKCHDDESTKISTAITSGISPSTSTLVGAAAVASCSTDRTLNLVPPEYELDVAEPVKAKPPAAPRQQVPPAPPPAAANYDDDDMSMRGAETSQSECSQGKTKSKVKKWQKMQMMTQADGGVSLLEVDDSNDDGEETIEYNMDYRRAEESTLMDVCPGGKAEEEEGEENSSCGDTVTTSLSARTPRSIQHLPGDVDMPEEGLCGKDYSLTESMEEGADEAGFGIGLDAMMSSSWSRPSVQTSRTDTTARSGLLDSFPNSSSRLGSASWLRPHAGGGDDRRDSANMGEDLRPGDGDSRGSDSASNSSNHGLMAKYLSSPSGDINVNTDSTGNNNNNPFSLHPLFASAAGSSNAALKQRAEATPSPVPSSTETLVCLPTSPAGDGSGAAQDQPIGATCTALAPQPMPSTSAGCRMSELDFTGTGDRYLIFTTGMKTYTPHQIGIKRIRSLEEASLPGEVLLKDPQHGVQVLPDSLVNRDEFDTVDHLIELHGHIIGMCLSPDHR